MQELSKDFDRFELELASLVHESTEAKDVNDLRKILIRINALQRIVFEELNRSKEHPAVN